MAVYPAAIPDIPATGWTHDQVAQEVEAICAELGINPRGGSATVKARMDVEHVISPRPVTYRSGEWYAAHVWTHAANTMTAGTMRVMPFVLHMARTFDRINVEVTAGVASTTVRLFIYGDDGTGYPGSLVLDAGTVDSSTTGFKEIVISQTLQPGRYWLGNMGIGGTPTLRTNSGQIALFAMNPASGNVVSSGWTHTPSGGTLPATWPAGSATSNIAAAVKLRAA